MIDTFDDNAPIILILVVKLEYKVAEGGQKDRVEEKLGRRPPILEPLRVRALHVSMLKWF